MKANLIPKRITLDEEGGAEKKFKEKYQIIERISEGNFGTVYKVRDTRTSRLA